MAIGLPSKTVKGALAPGFRVDKKWNIRGILSRGTTISNRVLSGDWWGTGTMPDLEKAMGAHLSKNAWFGIIP